MVSYWLVVTRCLAALLLLIAGLFAATAPAHAYVGPGIALGALGAGFGVMMTGLSAVFYLSVMWCRRLWRRLSGRAQAPAEVDSANSDS
jgi:membrane protein implicated in regulation of membrane protease activity